MGKIRWNPGALGSPLWSLDERQFSKNKAESEKQWQPSQPLTTGIGTHGDTFACTHSFTHITMHTQIILDYNEFYYLHFSVESLLFLFNTHIFIWCRSTFETNNIPKRIIKISIFWIYYLFNINFSHSLPFIVVQCSTDNNSHAKSWYFLCYIHAVLCVLLWTHFPME